MYTINNNIIITTHKRGCYPIADINVYYDLLNYRLLEMFNYVLVILDFIDIHMHLYVCECVSVCHVLYYIL